MFCGAAGTPLPYPLRAFPDSLRAAPFSFQLFSFQLFSSAGTPYRLRAFPDSLRAAPFSFQLFSSAGTPLPYPLRAVPMGIRLVYFVGAVSLSPSSALQAPVEFATPTLYSFLTGARVQVG
jgi:hypothetical protein